MATRTSIQRKFEEGATKFANLVRRSKVVSAIPRKIISVGSGELKHDIFASEGQMINPKKVYKNLNKRNKIYGHIQS